MAKFFYIYIYMKKSFRKIKYSNRKYSKKRYKTNKKRGNTKKKRKYTKRRNKKKTSHRKNLLGGARQQEQLDAEPEREPEREPEPEQSGPAGFAQESASFPIDTHCLALLDTKNNWIPINLNITRKRSQGWRRLVIGGREQEDSEWDFLDPLLFEITTLDNNKTVLIQSNECFIQKKKKSIQKEQELKMGAQNIKYSFQITIGLSADTEMASDYLHKTTAEGMKSKLIIGFPSNKGCNPEKEYMQLLRAFPDSELTITEKSILSSKLVEDKIDFASIVNIYGEFQETTGDKVKTFNCFVFNHGINKWTELDVQYFVSESGTDPKYFIKIGGKIVGSSTIYIVKPKNNRSDSENVNPTYQLRLNLNPQFQMGGSLSNFPHLEATSDTLYSHKLILGWDDEYKFKEFLEMQPDTEWESVSGPETEPEIVSIPIYKNKSLLYSTTNIVFVSGSGNGGTTKVFFNKEGTTKMAGSSPQNGSLEGWAVEYVPEIKLGGGITGVDTPHGLITLRSPVKGKLYVGLDGGKYINPIKIVPRVGEDGVGSQEETLKLHKKLEEIIEDSLLDLYIQAVVHVISKFKNSNGLNTGGVFMVRSDYLSKYGATFNEILSGLNSATLPHFKKYVDTLPNNPWLLADLLKIMYGKMPFDIISEKELDILTPEDTDNFYESLGVDSKRSVLLNLLLSLLKEIHDSSYSGDEKMTAEALAPFLTTSLKLDVLLKKKLLEGGMGNKGGMVNKGIISEINDKMETLILFS